MDDILPVKDIAAEPPDNELLVRNCSDGPLVVADGATVWVRKSDSYTMVVMSYWLGDNKDSSIDVAFDPRVSARVAAALVEANAKAIEIEVERRQKIMPRP